MRQSTGGILMRIEHAQFLLGQALSSLGTLRLRYGSCKLSNILAIRTNPINIYSSPWLARRFTHTHTHTLCTIDRLGRWRSRVNGRRDGGGASCFDKLLLPFHHGSIAVSWHFIPVDGFFVRTKKQVKTSKNGPLIYKRAHK